MQGNDLDRRAQLQRFIRKLRADCVFYGCDEVQVKRWSLERLVRERDRAVKRLMSDPPEGKASTWDG